MFIVFEGIDGTGKSTQAKLLADAIEGGYLTAEPTKGPIGNLIRERLYQGETDVHVMRRLFSADRHDHINTVINPVLEAGGVVVSDRYLLSSMAYQVDSLYIHTQLTDVLKLNELGQGIPVPDLTIYIDLFPEKLPERLNSRGRGLDSFENLAHLEEVQEKYTAAIDRVQKIGWSVVSVSGEGSAEYVHSRIMQIVRSKLGDQLSFVSDR